MRVSADLRFWSKVDKSGPCWVWLGARMKNGHGNFRFEGRVVSAHRFAWQLTHGAIPRGLLVLHSCDNAPCVNPDHLRLGTFEDNVADLVERKRAGGFVARVKAEKLAKAGRR